MYKGRPYRKKRSLPGKPQGKGNGRPATSSNLNIQIIKRIVIKRKREQL